MHYIHLLYNIWFNYNLKSKKNCLNLDGSTVNPNIITSY